MDILSVDTENHFNNCVRGGDSRMKQDGGDVPEVHYVDLTPVSQLKVAKTGAISGQRRQHLWLNTLLRYHSITVVIDWVHHLILECCSGWAYVADALPPARVRNWYIYPGIALCVVSPTIPSLYYEFVFLPQPVWYPLTVTRSGDGMILDGLLGLLCVKGDMGSPERYLKVSLFYCRHYYNSETLLHSKQFNGSLNDGRSQASFKLLVPYYSSLELVYII